MDGSKTGFDVKNSKDRHGFKAESADTASEWVSLLKGILEDTIPEEEESEEERSKGVYSETCLQRPPIIVDPLDRWF